MSLPILLGQRPRFSIPFHIQLVHTCASLPHFAERAYLLWVVITLGLCGVASVWGHVLSPLANQRVLLKMGARVKAGERRLEACTNLGRRGECSVLLEMAKRRMGTARLHR